VLEDGARVLLTPRLAAVLGISAGAGVGLGMGMAVLRRFGGRRRG